MMYPYDNYDREQEMRRNNPNWNGMSTAQPVKKNHGALKFIAASLAVLVIAFGGGYLGSMMAGRQSGLSGTTVTSSEGGADSSSNVQQSLVNTVSGYDSTEATMIEQVVAATANSVVEITTESVTTDSYFHQRILSGAGSGVIVTSDGYIVTNHHVIDGSDKITVTLRDGTQYSASLIGSDSKTDIALLKIEASGLTPVVMGDSSKLNVGEPAIVIGNPLGQLGGTVTNGIISALDRQITTSDGQVMTLLQTNAAINPGNSGGALFNANGELVGIVNAKSGGTSDGTTIEGLGFAIPINIARPVIEDLRTYGYVQGRVDLGLSFVDISDAMTAMMYRVNSLGVYVMQVTGGSNAALAGIQAGDLVVSVNGTAVSTEAEINTVIDSLSVGDTVTLGLERSGRSGSLSFVLQQLTGAGASL